MPRGGDASARYEQVATLGVGGMAVVYEVVDRATGMHVALKRLRLLPGAPKSETVSALFEREYLTLVQLSHPCIVAAYDYGIDTVGPYYTMELLDGGDLQGLSPLPWLRAATIARDIASALALLHSRRTVYRDLSPRNVRCTSNGAAKLIDFGAMTPMGPSREFVGTMPFVAPEALNQQALDGRTDLYALDATLYFTLVQRHAYPARDVAQLRDLFRSRPRCPSELVPGIPEALDQLVMDLLHLDPAARPASAAEVIARLGAIAGLRGSEHLLVSQAYLSNPTLVGRGESLAQARRLTFKTLHQHGAALVIRGAPGAGRSRLLDAHVLEAKLAGLTVLRADASDAQKSSCGVVRALAAQLLKTLGKPARDLFDGELALLGDALPELRTDRQDIARDSLVPDARTQHTRMQQTLRRWLLDVARSRPLMLAVDDLPRIDEFSAGCLALLAQEVHDHAILIATTCGDDDIASSAARGAIELLASSSLTVSLTLLTLDQTEQLLRSVFGDVPNLSVLARYVQEVSGGTPRDIMRLAQHLVTEQVIRYQAGAWSVPKQLDASSLPASMAEALRIRILSLDADALGLALAFALEPKQSFSFQECVLLAPTLATQQHARLLPLLDDLVAAEVLLCGSDHYTLRQTSWVRALEGASSIAQREAAHLRLARVFEAHADPFRVAQHLLKGGEPERGLDALLAHAVESEQRTDADAGVFYEVLATLPPDWLRTYEQGLAVCDTCARPAKHRDILLSRLCGLVSFAVSETDGYAYLEARIERLRKECGLDDFAALPSTLDPATRLQTALQAAGARFMRTPAHERVGDPTWAIRQIVKSTLAALGAITFTLDHAACRRLPSLAPLTPLSPAVDVVCKLTEGLGARLAGRVEECVEIYRALLARMAQPDRAGLTEVHHLTTRLRIIQGLGMIDAAIGRASCLEHAKEVEREPLLAIQAMFLRHIYLVWQGRTEEADLVKQQIEIARIESNARYGFEGQHLLSELVAYALAEDMTRVKRATDAVEPRARVHRAWAPVLSFGRGEYHRIRGDYAAALEEHERGLSLIDDGQHQVWVYTAGAHVRTLTALGRLEDARREGEAHLATATRRGVGYLRSYLRMPLSLALSKTGAHAEAMALADAVLANLHALASSGLLLASAHETRALVAREAGDQACFAQHAAQAAAQWSTGDAEHKRARSRRLVREGSQGDPALLEELSVISQFSSMLEGCDSTARRAHCGLAFLVGQSGARGGALYVHQRRRLVRAAVYGDADLDADTESALTRYFMREIEEADGTAAFSDPPDPTYVSQAHAPGERRVVRVLLTHASESATAITGVALLAFVTGSAFIYPTRVAAELSRTLARAGDAEPIEV